jgi:hypothetical protein
VLARLSWLLVALALMLGYCAAAHGTELSFTKTLSGCKVATVSKRGNDVIMRCDGKDFTIANQPLSCPAFRYTRDAAGNLVVHC